MLIVCLGPDVYRALEKAHELEAAFRQKYDPDGSSIEHLHQDGTELIDEVVERVNTVSLFTPRRFICVRDLLIGCPKGRVAALEKALVIDPENVIVVSVEKDLPPDVTLKTLSVLPKYVRYDFPRLDTRAFESWIRERATKLGYSLSDGRVKDVAEFAEGDSWQAMFALLQFAAEEGVADTHTSTKTKTEVERSLFDWADAYVRQEPGWRAAVERLGAEALLYPFLSQLRAYQRVKTGEDSGILSFVVRKLKGIHSSDSEEQFARVLEAVMLQRQGFLREDELATLF